MKMGGLLGTAAFAALIGATPALAQQPPFPPEFISAMQGGQYDAAARVMRPALAACEARAQGGECWALHIGLGQALSMLPAQQYKGEVVAQFGKALALADRFAGPESRQSFQSGQMLAMYLIAQGDTQQALPVFERMVPLARKLAGPGSPIARTMMSGQAMALMLAQRLAEGSKVTDALVADLRGTGEVDGVLEVMLDRTEMYFGDKAMAEKLRREIVAAPEFARSTNAALKVKILVKLAQSLFDNGNRVDGVEFNQRAIALAASAGVNTPEAQAARATAARYAEGGAFDSAGEKRVQCEQARAKFGDRYAGAVSLCMAYGYAILMDRRTEAQGLALIRDNYAIARADYRNDPVFGMASLMMGLVNLVEGRLDEAIRNYDDSNAVLQGLYGKSQDQIVLKAMYAGAMRARPDLLPRARVIARDVVDSTVRYTQSRPGFDEQSIAQLRQFAPMTRLAVKVNWQLYASAGQGAR